jgi:arylsulfatase A-like enzyme
MFGREHRDYPWAPETHRRALEWIDEARGNEKPFFLFINDFEPHFPYTPPRETEAGFLRPGVSAPSVAAAREVTSTDLFTHNLGGARIPAGVLRVLSDFYDGEIACLDDAIGDMLDRLGERGILDDTIVVITADHGENLGEHGFVDHMFSLHRTVCHVPLVLRFPPHFRGGRRVRSVVRLEDVAPTVLELAGLEVPGNLDGKTLLTDLTGRVSLGLMGAPSRFLDHFGPGLRPGDDLARLRTGARSIYDGRHHYIGFTNGREELYDLESDPGETRNLAYPRTPHAEVISRLRRRIQVP